MRTVTLGPWTFTADGATRVNGRQQVFSILRGWDDGPGVRSERTARPTSHGEFSQRGLREGRLVTLGGFVVASSEVEQAEVARDLSALLADGGFEDLTVADALGSLTTSVQLGGAPLVERSPHGASVRFQFDLLAPDPLRYGPLASASTGFPELVGGLRYPLYTDGAGVLASYEWEGAANRSPSVERVDGAVTRRNLVPNPSFETDVTFWRASAPTAAPGRTSEQARSGGYSAKLTSNGTNTYLFSEGTPGDRLPVDPSEPFTIGAAIFPTMPDRSFRLGFYEYDEAGVLLPQAFSTPVTLPAGQWTAVSHTFTPRSETRSARVFVGQIGTPLPAGESFYVDDVMAGPTGDYFDGDTPDRETSSVLGWLDYGEPSTSGTVSLSNPGTADAHPQFEVTGPASGFEVVQVGTGHRLVYDGTVPAGSRLVVDTASGVAVMDGVSDRTLTWQDPMTIPPGSTAEFAFVPRGASTAAVLRASVRGAWW